MRHFSILILAALAVACGDDDFVYFDAGTPDTPATPDAITADASSDTGADAGTDAGECDPGEVPDGRGEHASIYDAARNRLITYGGNTEFPEMCIPRNEYTNEVWVFDIDCGTWQNMTPLAGGPGRRSRQAAAYDQAGDRAFFFGGRTLQDGGGYRNYADLHVLDLEEMLWSPLAAGGPPARSHAAMAYDEANDRLIIFGGNQATSGIDIRTINDTWAYDLGTNEWTEIAADRPPSPRYGHAFAQDDGALYVFGGTSGGFFNDTWAFDFATDSWTPIAGGGPGAPATRFGAALFVDGAGGLVMAAGHDSTDLGNTNEIWRVDIESGTWTEILRGDQLNGVPLGRCDFPPDFTIPDLDGPERRNFQGYAQGGGRGFLTHGKTDCGNANDVWAIDLTAPAWSLVGNATTSGEACNRSGRLDCTTLCF